MSTELWQTVFWVAGGLAAVGTAWTKLLKPVLASIRRAVDQVDEIVTILPVISDIAYEFAPNDGGSLRDQIDQIKLDIIELKTQIEHVLVRDPNERTRHDDNPPDLGVIL